MRLIASLFTAIIKTTYNMTKLFKNKYCIPSARLKQWDYSANGAYFITICTANKFHYFGTINNRMLLSEAGKLAHNYWQEYLADIHLLH